MINWNGFTNDMYNKMSADIEAGIIPEGGLEYGTILVGKQKVSVFVFRYGNHHIICLANRNTRKSIHMEPETVSYFRFRLSADLEIRNAGW